MSNAPDTPSEENRDEIRFKVSPEIIIVSDEKKMRMVRIGELSHQVMIKVSRLVANAFNNNDPDLAWLRKLLLGSIPSEYHVLASDLMIACGDRNPVSIFRADVVGGGKIAELQCPGSGWAFGRMLEKRFGISAEESLLLKAFKQWADGRVLSWWLQTPFFESSVRDLIKELELIGVKVVFAPTASEFDPESAEAVIRRPQLPDLIAEPKGRQLLKLWLNGKVEMDLLPTMVTDTKYMMAIMYHEQFRHLFSDEERDLCPTTTFIQSRDQVIENRWGKPSTIEQEFERRPKDFILKYGGGRKDLRSGSHAVYYLGAKSMKSEVRAELLSKAILDWKDGEGWLLQEFRPERETGKQNCYSLMRPHYFFNKDNGKVVMVHNCLTMCNTWKVHAQSSATIGLIG